MAGPHQAGRVPPVRERARTGTPGVARGREFLGRRLPPQLWAQPPALVVCHAGGEMGYSTYLFASWGLLARSAGPVAGVLIHGALHRKTSNRNHK